MRHIRHHGRVHDPRSDGSKGATADLTRSPPWDAWLLILLAPLSLVIFAAIDNGIAVGSRLGYSLASWRVVSLALAAAFFVAADGSALRLHRSLSPAVVRGVAAFVVVAAVAVFGFGAGAVGLRTIRGVTNFTLIGPIREELLFRGALFSACVGAFRRTRYAGAVAVIVTAILFAAAHIQYFNFDIAAAVQARWYTPMMGLFFGYLRWRSGSIWPALLAHSISNGFGALATP